MSGLQRGYKKVRPDLTDFQTGTKLYTIGSVVEEANIDETDAHCARGLHLCWRLTDCLVIWPSQKGRIIEVEFAQRDFLGGARTADDGDGKFRVRRLRVVKEMRAADIAGPDIGERIRRLESDYKRLDSERHGLEQILAHFPEVVDGAKRRCVRVPPASAPRAFVETVWRAANEATGHSWQRLNSSLHQAVSLAIAAGMHFNDDDIATIDKNYRGAYWLGDVEGLYAHAVAVGNHSACKSIETFLGRPRFTLGSEILCVGAQLRWKEQSLRVTSFGHDALIACAYHTNSSKVKARVTITLDVLAAANKATRDAKKAAAKVKVSAEASNG